jgi:hypothetical protein
MILLRFRNNSPQDCLLTYLHQAALSLDRATERVSEEMRSCCASNRLPPPVQILMQLDKRGWSHARPEESIYTRVRSLVRPDKVVLALSEVDAVRAALRALHVAMSCEIQQSIGTRNHARLALFGAARLLREKLPPADVFRADRVHQFNETPNSELRSLGEIARIEWQDGADVDSSAPQ